jgi:hypothetical protein
MIRLLNTKTALTLILSIVLLVWVGLVSCSKDKPVTPSLSNSLPPPMRPPTVVPPAYRIPLVSNAYNRYDQWISDKVDSATLSAISPTSVSVSTYRWRKISGPGNPTIDDSTRLTTRVRNLQVGEYIFLITATDALGNSDRDSVRIYVIKPTATNVTLKNLSWTCPMGCTSQSIYKVYDLVPRNQALTVFIKYSDSNVWEAATPYLQWNLTDQYFWSIEEGIFSMYTDWPREGVKFDVRIDF